MPSIKPETHHERRPTAQANDLPTLRLRLPRDSLQHLQEGAEMSTHTATPWQSGAYECANNDDALRICKEEIDATKTKSSGHFYIVYLDDGRRIALVGHGPNGAANAEFIVKACNAHDELVAALQGAEAAAHSVLIAGGDYGDELGDRGLRDMLSKSNDAIRAAIAKAGVSA
jgi:hypothetical protein